MRYFHGGAPGLKVGDLIEKGRACLQPVRHGRAVHLHAQIIGQIRIPIKLECRINPRCVNVLDDDKLRQGIKDFTHWPTFPQLYIRGEFVGGCDIITELYESGELQKRLM